MYAITYGVDHAWGGAPKVVHPITRGVNLWRAEYYLWLVQGPGKHSRPHIKGVVMYGGTPGRSDEITPLINGALIGHLKYGGCRG